MPGRVLTVSSAIMCPHGGQARPLTTTNARAIGPDGPILLESDVHPVVGCPFTVGTKYSPCVRIEWSAGTSAVTSGGTSLLVETSTGRCIGIEGTTQGIAIVVATQYKDSAR
jgi:hypothetical protein